MKPYYLVSFFCVIMAFLLVASPCSADQLIFSNNKKIKGSLCLIGTTYIEFKTDDLGPNTQWIKVPKKDLLCITSEDGKIIYPRDKFDENALNFGKVKIRTHEDKEKYQLRQQENDQAEKLNHSAERNRYKTAALVSLVGGVMALILIGV